MLSRAFVKAQQFRSLVNTCLLETMKQTSKEPTYAHIKELGTHLKDLGEYQFVDEYEMDELTTCLVAYVELLFNFSLKNYPSKKNIMIMKYLFTAILELITSVELKNAFLIKGTAKIFDILLDNIRPWFAKPLLRTYNTILHGSDRKVRSDVLTSMGIMALYKLIDTLSIYGDYEYQTMIIEALYRICSVDILKEHTMHFIPESAELSSVLCKINTKKFDEDVRKFLNIFNADKSTIFSTTCSWIKLDSLISDETLLPEGICMDFDLVDCSITWNCRKSLIEDLESSVLGTEADADWEYITLLGDHVQTYATKRLKKQLLVTMHLNGPCITTSPHLQPILDKMRSLQFLVNDSSVTNHIIVNILPKMFKKSHQVQRTPEISGRKRFSRTSARGYAPLKIVYSSLTKNHPILDKSGSNWSITHSALERANVDERPVEERSAKEDSIQSNIAQIHGSSDSTGEYETARPYTPTQNFFSLDRLLPEVSNKPDSHEKHSSSKNERRFSRSKTVVSDEFNWSNEIPLARLKRNPKPEERISFSRGREVLKENSPDNLLSVDKDIDLVKKFSGIIRDRKFSMPRRHRIERDSFDDLKPGTKTTISKENEPRSSDLKKDKSFEATDIVMSKDDREHECGNGGSSAVICSEKSIDGISKSSSVAGRVNDDDILETDCSEPGKSNRCDVGSYDRSKDPSMVTDKLRENVSSVNGTLGLEKSQDVNEIIINSSPRVISQRSFGEAVKENEVTTNNSSLEISQRPFSGAVKEKVSTNRTLEKSQDVNEVTTIKSPLEISQRSFSEAVKEKLSTTSSEENEKCTSNLEKDKSIEKADIIISEEDQEYDARGDRSLLVFPQKKICSEKSNEKMVQSIIVPDGVNDNDILDAVCVEPDKLSKCDEESYNRSQNPSVVTNKSNKRAPLLNKNSNAINGSKKSYKSDKNLRVNFAKTEHEKNVGQVHTSKIPPESTKKNAHARTASEDFNPNKKQDLFVTLEDPELNSFEELKSKKKAENVSQFDGNLSGMSRKRKLFDPNDLSLMDLAVDSNEDVKRSSPGSASKMRRISLTLKVKTYEKCTSKSENRSSNKIKKKKRSSKKQNKRKSLSEVCQVLDKMKNSRISPEKNQKVRQLPWTFADLFSKLEKSDRYFDEPKEKTKNLKKPKRNPKNQKNKKSTFFDTIQRDRTDMLDDSLSSLWNVKDKVIARNCTPDVKKIKESLLTSDLEPKPIKENSKIKIISDVVLIPNKFRQEISKSPPEPYPHEVQLGTSLNASEGKEEEYAKLGSSIQTESKKRTLKLFSELFLDVFAQNKKSPENQEMVFRNLENLVCSLNK